LTNRFLKWAGRDFQKNCRAIALATYTIGKTSLDFNAGYYAISISRADFDDDRWFVGQTIRQMLNEKWTLLAELFAFLPNTQAGGHANWFLAANRNGPFAKTFLSAHLSAPLPATKAQT